MEYLETIEIKNNEGVSFELENHYSMFNLKKIVFSKISIVDVIKCDFEMLFELDDKYYRKCNLSHNFKGIELLPIIDTDIKIPPYFNEKIIQQEVIKKSFFGLIKEKVMVDKSVRKYKKVKITLNAKNPLGDDIMDKFECYICYGGRIKKI
jgi:hypothetical protein